MTNAEQAAFWLNEAQHWLTVVQEAEADLEKHLRQRGFREEELPFQVYIKGKDHFWYQRAGRKLESAERRATMYASLALLEKEMKEN